MIKRKLITGSVLATTLAVMTFSGAAGAREGGPDGANYDRMHKSEHRGGGMEGHGPHAMFRGLDLTDEQRAKVEEIQRGQESVMKEKMKALHESNENLRAATFTKTFDAKKVRSLADAQAKLMADLAVARAETSNKIYNLLTPEQQKQFAERNEERRGRFSR